jgi:glycosyltransferase involved in cell wall biosynthesis
LRVVGPTQAAPRFFIVDVSEDPEVRALGRFYESPRSYHEQLIAMVPDHLRSQVEFVGPQSSSQVVHEYGRATVVVLPAVGPESFGMPVIEAGAAGRPVVVSDIGGLPEVVVDETTGLVVPRNDPDALVKALERLLDDPELRERMGRQGREQVVEHFTWDVVAEQLGEQLSR